MLSIILILSILFNGVVLQNQKKSSDNRAVVKFLLLFQNGQDHVQQWLEEALRRSENNINSRLQYNYNIAKVDVSNNLSFTSDALCKFYEDGYPVVLDVTWGNVDWVKLYQIALYADLPYFKMDLTIGPTLRILDSYLQARNGTDVTIIFETTDDVQEALFYWVDRTSLRMLMMEGLDDVSSERLKTIRPLPSFYVVIAKTRNMVDIIKKALNQNLMKLAERWILVFLDMEDNSEVKSLIMGLPVSLIYYDKSMCCAMQKIGLCDECPSDFVLQEHFFKNFVYQITKYLNELQKDFPEVSSPIYNCSVNSFPTTRLFELINHMKTPIYTVDENHIYSVYFNALIEMGRDTKIFERIAKYNDREKIKLEPGIIIKPIKKYFRIGTAESIPWAYQETDSITKSTHLAGYCVDFARRLSEVMNFDYELVIPKSKTFGKRDRDGKWNGAVGDLVRGDTDMIVGALTMTAEREEVIDYVAPYFEQTGISIVMRNPVRKTSLFKFMTVLRLEVWLSIVAALVITGFMIWFLDKYSPYSARNNKKAYPYPCRKFTLKESFWFALTSFTPQGGGEAPKALSGRTLVAAYWLFVVLMLATFTANLAAFLTVERMQSPVQSLEQLAKQSRINYTVKENSWAHQYFINMKFAEDTLYRLWKELTLNASTDETQYRVWDYPIREQYGHILLAINDSIPVDNATQGFQKVVDHIDADFAFIHDSSEIKYEISRNCNLTEIGEVFAERPYAVAVQQGSHMSDELSKVILDLQKDRFFEDLKSKYWNNSAKGVCPDTEDSEGITLESLGGVFIATLFGLALAMLTLFGEVIYYKRKKRGNKVTDVKPITDDTIKPMTPNKKNWSFEKKTQKNNRLRKDQSTKTESKDVTIGSTFQPVLGNRNKPASDSFNRENYLTIYSGSSFHPDKNWYWDRNFLY